MVLGELNQTSDNSGEWVWDNPLYPQSGPAGTLDVGDVLFAISEFSTNEDLSGGGGTNAYGLGANTMAFTAVSAAQVKTILPPTGGAVGRADFEFGPVDPVTIASMAVLEPSLGPVASTLTSPGWAPGTLFAAYENTPGTAFSKVEQMIR